MRSNTGILDDALAGVAAAVEHLGTQRSDTLTTAQRLAALTTLAGLTRQLAAAENELIAGLQREATLAELGDSLSNTLARVTLTTTAEAKRRIRDAEDTAPRTALNGEPLPPRFPTTAAMLAAGRLDRDHIREIHRFFDKIPAAIPADERDNAEAFLAELATGLNPDELHNAAEQMLALLGHEDDFTDTDRARRRGFTWSRPDADGMSKATLWATPELRAESTPPTPPGPPPANATPTTKPPASTATPISRPPNATPAPPPNATTTPS